MFRLRQTETARPLFQNRYADEWVGLLVLAAIVMFAVAVVEAGFLRQWLTPEKKLHFILPESGVAGLAIGNDIEVMGVHAGEIRRLKLNETGRMYAEGDLDPQFANFIRQDSTAVIRHRLIVAGASYIELGRGKGKPLDWDYAVLQATVEANPADVITQTVMDLRSKLVPAMNNVQLITAQVNDMMTDMRKGQGTIGGLLVKDDVLDKANAALAHLDTVIADLKPIEKQVGGVMTKVDGTMDNARAATAGLRQSMPQIQQTIGHANTATAQLPALLAQAEASASSLRKLTDQLRGLWLLGGGGTKQEPSHRLPAQAVRP
ncbi:MULTISPECIES: MlaD family protein [Gluconobacter]|uniref:ABC transporter substrate-binding protein n=1 Tax=Gluconobacter albidus TaxID=318683 RepID=A0A149TEB5_9PROT|nr:MULTISPECIES: MlaD family protein [Gluconobacter]KXV45697.1 ABC transporter substrate-binding protein [Gluconobacter albidus]MBS1027554.1 MCE family protein [Gluconobacter albidus]OUI83287.1 ABC transporter substrate-binding protein [Gluconobacter sp. DsW_056]